MVGLGEVADEDRRGGKDDRRGQCDGITAGEVGFVGGGHRLILWENGQVV